MFGISHSFMLTFVVIGFGIFVSCNPIPADSKSLPVSETLEEKDTRDVTTKSASPAVDAVAEASVDYDDSDIFMEAQEGYGRSRLPDTPLPSSGVQIQQDHSIELQGGSQTFFPSFASLFQPRQQPLGHSRPLISYNQEGAYSQRPSNPLRQLLNYQSPSYSGFRNNDFAKSATTQSADSSGILGSGNFGVIPGGTFFSDSGDTESDSDSYDSPYYNNNNGHGRPSFFFGGGNPRPSYNQDQFANFRDFADINAPSNSAYSHFVVVYANKNATVTDVENNNFDIIKTTKEHHSLSSEPKNIIERLAQIDKEKESALPTEEPVKVPKTSKTKQKLALIKDKKYNKNNYNKNSYKRETKDLSDPLLALS